MILNLIDASFALSLDQPETPETPALIQAREVLRRLEEERDIILRDIEFQQQMIAELAAQAHLEARRRRDREA